MQIALEQTLTQMTVADLVALIEQIVENKLQARPEPLARSLELRAARSLELRAALLRECQRLDPVEEQAWAELGMTTELAQWPAY